MTNWRKNAYLFLFAQSISLFGSMVTGFAITWYITLKTGSGFWLAAAMIAYLLPMTLISVVSGGWADRFSRKWLIILSDGSIAVATAILAILFALGYQQIWVLIFFTLIRSVGQGIQTPAVNAAFPQLVPESDLTRINGLNQTAQSLSNLLAPMLGGLILASLSLPFAFMVDISTAIIEVGTMIFIPLPRLKQAHTESDVSEQALVSALKYINKLPDLRRLIIFWCVSYFLFTPISILSLLLIQRVFGGHVLYLTLQEVLWSGGSILGGIVIARIGQIKNNQRTILISSFIIGIGMLLMGVVQSFPIFLVLCFISGLAMPFTYTAQTVIVQTATTEAYMGRVFAIIQIANGFTMLIGALLSGPLADKIPIQLFFIICGILMPITAIVYWQRVRRGGLNNSTNETITTKK